MKFANYIGYVDDQDAVAAIRPTHRAYLAGLLESGQLAVAAPFDDGAGALFVYEAESIVIAEKFAPEVVERMSSPRGYRSHLLIALCGDVCPSAKNLWPPISTPFVGEPSMAGDLHIALPRFAERKFIIETC